MTSSTSLAAQIAHFLNLLIFLEKKSVFQFGEVKLYPSEIHLMDVVAGGESVNATAMAARLGVTKGAVSQTLTRLEKKGMITKTRDPLNKNEVTVHFTDDGREAMERFQQARAASHQAHMAYLSGLTDGEKTAIERFLAHMENYLADLR